MGELKECDIQVSAKEWSLGCVKCAPAPRGGQDARITQPRDHSLADPFKVLTALSSFFKLSLQPLTEKDAARTWIATWSRRHPRPHFRRRQLRGFPRLEKGGRSCRWSTPRTAGNSSLLRIIIECFSDYNSVENNVTQFWVSCWLLRVHEWNMMVISVKINISKWFDELNWPIRSRSFYHQALLLKVQSSAATSDRNLYLLQCRPRRIREWPRIKRSPVREVKNESWSSKMFW